MAGSAQPFVCQRCGTKLLVADTFNAGSPLTGLNLKHVGVRHDLDPFIVLSGGIPRAQLGATLGPGRPDLMDESYVVLTSHPGAPTSGDPDAAAPVVPQGQAWPAAKVFEAVAERTDVPHPVCMPCTRAIHAALEDEAVRIERECEMYQQALDRISRDASSDPQAEVTLSKQLQALQVEEEAQLREEERLVAEHRRLVAQAEQLTAALRDVEQQEERFLEHVNEAWDAACAHAEERAVVYAQMRHARGQLEVLERAHAYRDLFHIWAEGPFGTISGLRLGRTTEVPVPWEEINAAWGQCVLLLYSMAHQCRVTFSGYSLVPCGSFSKIRDQRNQVYVLHGPPKFKLKGYLCPMYDRAMEGFLACLSDFADFALQMDQDRKVPEPFALPFKIKGDRVGGQSVRLSMSKEAKWTSALKMMLADLAMVQGWAAEYQQWLWAQSRRADAARPGAPVGDAPAEAGPREEP